MVSCSQGVCSDLYESSVTLEELESLAQALTAGVSTQDRTANLVELRRQWNSLCERAKSESQTLSTDVTHWNVYQNQLQQLSPWLQNATVRLQEEVVQCSSLEEAHLQLKQHEVCQPWELGIGLLWKFCRYFSALSMLL